MTLWHARDTIIVQYLDPHGDSMEDLSKYEQELRQIDAELSHKKEGDRAWREHIRKSMNALRIYLGKDRITLRIGVYDALRFLEHQAYNCLAEGSRLSCTPDRIDTAVPVYSNKGGVESIQWYSYEYLKRFDDSRLYLAIFDIETKMKDGGGVHE